MTSEEPIAVIITIIFLALLLIGILPIFSSLANINHAQQCATEIGQITDLNSKINALNAERYSIASQLNTCQNDYSTLIQYNITKQDFSEIKGELGQTNVYVNNTYSRLENIENKINNFSQTLYNFNISLILNVFFAFEILSFILVKQEFLQWIWEVKLKKRKENLKD